MKERRYIVCVLLDNYCLIGIGKNRKLLYKLRKCLIRELKEYEKVVKE